MKPPGDVVSSFFEQIVLFEGGSEYTAMPNPQAHEQHCSTFWGSHGCERPRGHNGPCWCDCCDCQDHPDPDPINPGNEPSCVAGPPYYGPTTNFYGDDIPEATRLAASCLTKR